MTPPLTVRAFVLTLAAMLAATSLAGCIAVPEDVEALSATTETASCSTTGLPTHAAPTGPSLVTFVCDGVVGAAASLVKFPCAAPSDAGLTASLDVTSGFVQVIVQDADDVPVFVQWYDDESEPFDEVRFQGGEAGEWMALVQRSEEFAGSFSFGVLCGVA